MLQTSWLVQVHRFFCSTVTRSSLGSAEVLVVDGQSSDHSIAVAAKHGAKVMRVACIMSVLLLALTLSLN